MSKAHKSQYLRFRSIREYLPISIANLWLEHQSLTIYLYTKYIFYLHLQYQSIPAQIDLVNSYIVFPSHTYGQYLDRDPATHNQNHSVPKSVLYNLAM